MLRIMGDTPTAGFTDPAAAAGPTVLPGSTGPPARTGARTEPAGTRGSAGSGGRAAFSDLTGSIRLIAPTGKDEDRAGRPDMLLDYLRDTLADARRRVRRENETAAVLLATTGAAAGAVVAGLSTGHWSPGELPSRIEWLWWTSMFLWLMGLLVLGGALCPPVAAQAGRVLERRRCHLRGYAGRLRTGVPPREADGRRAGPRIDLLVLEIRRLNALADAKQRYVRRGVLLMGFSIACCVLSAFVGRPV